MKQGIILFAAILVLSLLPGNASAQQEEADTDLDQVTASPKEGWADVPKKTEHSLGRKILLWLPNRVADLYDVFRVDVGVGPSIGAVARVTKYAQAGYRQMSPASVRGGLMGRRAPVMIERDNEFGVSPFFSQSEQRKICAGELGAGIDIVLVGAYGGICVDELADFFGGLFLYDMKDDDWE